MTSQAALFNMDGSPTGRIMSDAPDTSVGAALRVHAVTQREAVYGALVAAARMGYAATSVELVDAVPQLKVSNRANSRLGELWEAGRAAVLRENGTCRLGVCHPHDKPFRVHRPQAKCWDHGKPLTRAGAALWVAL